MNRTIRTAAELDALPVKAVLLDDGGWPVWRDPHEGWCAANGTRDIPADLLIADGAPLTILHDPSAPVVPAMSDAAVPSATRDEVARALEGEFGCFLARDPHRPDAFWGGAADALLARFTITPEEDR